MNEVLTSPTNPRVKHLSTLRDRRHRRRHATTLVEGVEEIRRAVDAGVDVRGLYVAVDAQGTPSVSGVDDLLGRRQLTAADEILDALDGDLAGDLARGVSAHAVGDDEESIGDDEVGLVVASGSPWVRGRADLKLCHRRPCHCASITVVPT